MKKVEKHWDYTKNAKYYVNRPNYAQNSIDILCNLIKKQNGGG